MTSNVCAQETFSKHTQIQFNRMQQSLIPKIMELKSKLKLYSPSWNAPRAQVGFMYAIVVSWFNDNPVEMGVLMCQNWSVNSCRQFSFTYCGVNRKEKSNDAHASITCLAIKHTIRFVSALLVLFSGVSCDGQRSSWMLPLWTWSKNSRRAWLVSSDVTSMCSKLYPEGRCFHNGLVLCWMWCEWRIESNGTCPHKTNCLVHHLTLMNGHCLGRVGKETLPGLAFRLRKEQRRWFYENEGNLFKFP